MKKFNSLIPILTMIAIILVSLSASCDKRNPPPILPAPKEPIKLEDIRVIHKITASPDTIYADNNVTYSEIAVEVKDGEGFGVIGQMVQFKTDIGRILTNVATDSSGIARSTFWDAGDVGMATITAIVRNFSESDPDSLLSADTARVNVDIQDIPPIQTVTLAVNNTTNVGMPYEMGVGQQIPVSAKAWNTNGELLPNNSLITFSCTTGRFFDSQGNDLGLETVARTFNGRASVQYNSGTQATTIPGATPGELSATIGGVTDSREIIVKPGTPASIQLKSYLHIDGEDVPSITSEVGSPHQIFMVASLKDMYFNECQNNRVDFSTDLGTFMNTAQTTAINTDMAGNARVRFTPGLSAGAATIKASSNNDTLSTQIIFTISSDEVYSMDFTEEQAIELNVANTGGASSAILRVKLRDINYNLVDSPYEVQFKIVNVSPPAGANLNGQPASEWVTVTSNGGEAQVSVNAGTESGVLKIQARCEKSEGVYITAEKPNVIIHAGPPHTLTPFFGGYNSGTEMQGGLWRIVAGSHVRDIYNNPVSINTAVWFELVGANAQIDGFGTVGNVSIEGDSLQGVAYTIITYHGTLTNEEITIYASSGGVPGLYTDILPLNQPNLYLDTDPGTVAFAHQATQPKEADILVYLVDGQGIPITGSQIMLTSSRGQIVYNTNYPPGGDNYPTSIPNRVFTNAGEAFGRIRTWWVEYPPALDLAAGPLEAAVEIQGWLVDTPEQPATCPLSVWIYPQGINPPY